MTWKTLLSKQASKQAEKSCMKNLFFSTLLFAMSNFVYAEQNLTCKNLKNIDVEDISIEQLMDTPVFLGASQQAACANEASNIVNLISHDEILSRGARDLTDVLQLIPGFTPGMSVSGIAAMGMRGISADEGKMGVIKSEGNRRKITQWLNSPSISPNRH